MRQCEFIADEHLADLLIEALSVRPHPQRPVWGDYSPASIWLAGAVWSAVLLWLGSQWLRLLSEGVGASTMLVDGVATALVLLLVAGITLLVDLAAAGRHLRFAVGDRLLRPHQR